jgi:ribosomal protein L31
MKQDIHPQYEPAHIVCVDRFNKKYKQSTP